MTRSPSADEDDQRVAQNGRETEDELRKRLEAEFEVEKQRIEREIRREVEEKQKFEQRIIGACFVPRRSCKGAYPLCFTLIDLSDEERQKIYLTADFGQFVEDSSKIIQRALSDAYDYTTDYRIGLDTTM